MRGQQERRRQTNYIGKRRSSLGKCPSLPRSNKLSVIGRLELFRTYVLWYRTYVLLARPTKVRCQTCERARPPSQASEMSGYGLFHIILLKMFLKLFLNICAQDKDQQDLYSWIAQQEPFSTQELVWRERYILGIVMDQDCISLDVVIRQIKT